MKKALFILLIVSLSITLKAQNTEVNNAPNQENIFTGNIDVMPEYKDGMDKFYARLANIPYTYYNRFYNCEGRVTVLMVVEKDGSLSNLKVLHSFSDIQDKEILRVIKRLNKWKPGLQNGKPVRVLFSIPIEFKLVKV